MPSVFGDVQTPSMNKITIMPFDQAWSTPFRLVSESL